MLQTDLNQFIGSENYYKHFLGYHYTDGVKYLAEKAGAYWLIDAILSHVHTNRKLRDEDFLSWKLVPTENSGCILTGDDGNNNILVTQDIPFTDFPFKEVDDDFMLFFSEGVLFLPSEN